MTDLSPVFVSLRTALFATLAVAVLGVLLAFWRVRTTSRTAHALDVVLLLPVVMPPTVVGLVLLSVFGPQSPVGRILGSIGIEIVFSWWATVITAVVVGLPLMYLSCRAAFQQVPDSVIAAARIEGCGELTILQKIVLPLAWPGVGAGALLAFARSLGEFGATLMLAGNIPGRTQTVPIALFFHVEAGAMREAWTMAAALMFVSVTAVLVMRRIELSVRS